MLRASSPLILPKASQPSTICTNKQKFSGAGKLTLRELADNTKRKAQAEKIDGIALMAMMTM